MAETESGGTIGHRPAVDRRWSLVSADRERPVAQVPAECNLLGVILPVLPQAAYQRAERRERERLDVHIIYVILMAAGLAGGMCAVGRGCEWGRRRLRGQDGAWLRAAEPH